MKHFLQHIETYWFLTLLALQALLVLLFYEQLVRFPIFFLVINIVFLLLLYIKMRDIFVRPLQKMNQDIEDFRQGKISRIGIYGEHYLFSMLAQLFNAMMQVLAGVRDEYLAGRELSDDVSHAGELQKFLAGEMHVSICGVEVVGNTKWAQQINGDTYGFFGFENQCYTFIGDATGHGVTSGLIGTMVNTMLEIYGRTLVDGDRVLSAVNAMLYPKLYGGKIMTLALLRWDVLKKKMYLTGAGHESVLIYNTITKKIHQYKSWGIALGMKPDISNYIEEREIPFSEGDVFILYSDGITEARNMQRVYGDFYSLSRLKKAVISADCKNAVDVYVSITKDFSRYLGADESQNDDVTLVCGSLTDSKDAQALPNIVYQEGNWTW